MYIKMYTMTKWGLFQTYKSGSKFEDQGCLAGSVNIAHDSPFWGCEFKLHIGHEDYFKNKTEQKPLQYLKINQGNLSY